MRGNAGPLREGKSTTWEGGVRVPFIARWPGHIPAGIVQREPAMTIDVLPTLAALTEAKLPEHKIDGKDIWPLLSGQKETKHPRGALFFYQCRELQAVRSGKWKLHLPHYYRSLAGYPGGTEGKPMPMKQLSTTLALYDLEKDPGEKDDVASANPDVVKRLETLADEARLDLGDSRTNTKGSGVREPDTDPAVSASLRDEEDATFNSIVFWMVFLTFAVLAEIGLVSVLVVTRWPGRRARKQIICQESACV